MRKLLVFILSFFMLNTSFAEQAARRHKKRSSSVKKMKVKGFGKYNESYFPEYEEIGKSGETEKESGYNLSDSAFKKGCSDLEDKGRFVPSCTYTLSSELESISDLINHVRTNKKAYKSTTEALIASDIWHNAEIMEADRLIDERKQNIKCLEMALESSGANFKGDDCLQTSSMFENIRSNYAPVLTSLFLVNTRTDVKNVNLEALESRSDSENFDSEIEVNLKGIFYDEDFEKVEKKIKKGTPPEICHKPTGVVKSEGILQITKLRDWNPRGKSCFKMKPFIIQSAKKYIDKIKEPLQETARIKAAREICESKQKAPGLVSTDSLKKGIYDRNVGEVYQKGVVDLQEPIYWKGVDTSNLILNMEDPGIENLEELSEDAPKSVKNETRKKLMKSLLNAIKKGSDTNSTNSHDGIIPALRARKKRASQSFDSIGNHYNGPAYTGNIDKPKNIIDGNRVAILDRYIASLPNDKNRLHACQVMTRAHIGMKQKYYDYERERFYLPTPWKTYGISYKDLTEAANTTTNYALIGAMVLAPPPVSVAANYIAMAKFGAENVSAQLSVREAAEKAKAAIDSKLSEIEKDKNDANFGSMGMLLWMGMSAGVLSSNAGGISFESQFTKAQNLLQKRIAPNGVMNMQSVRKMEKVFESIGLKGVDLVPEKLIGQTYETAMTWVKNRADFSLKILQRDMMVQTLGIIPRVHAAAKTNDISDYGEIKMKTTLEQERKKPYCK
ncbi:MAG: hypothetical protein KC493_15645 [Bacteriovoracaceae bacterium]|nr:hypothetical protein [Bacteriovoracaceae bacterium]